MVAANLAHLFGRVTRPFKPAAGSRRRRIALGAIPPSLRPADPSFYAEWADGRFALAGISIALVGRSPFAVASAPAAWRRALHGFDWLRHIPPSVDANAAQHVEALVAEWLAQGRRRASEAADPGVVARRVLSWLSHADVLLQTDDADHYDDTLKALSADLAALRVSTRSQPATAVEEGHRLLGVIALVAAGLCIGDDPAVQRTSGAALAAALSHRPGGSRDTVWRNPPVMVDLLLDLETLRRFHLMIGEPIPGFLTDAVGQFRDLVGGLMLADSTLARLGTMRAPDEKLALWLAVRHTGVQPSGPMNNAAAGFVRLVAGATCAVADVGAPLAARHALGFEMSTGAAPLIVHDGLSADGDGESAGTLLFLSPKPAAGSSDANRRHAPSLEPAHTVTAEIAAGAPQRVDATHAGHARRGMVHRRRLTLSTDGSSLEGIDELRPLVGAEAEPGNLAFAVRFVLHPDVRVALGATPDTVDLTAGNGHCWRLTAHGHALSVEGAAYRSGADVQQTLQVLAMADPSVNRLMSWRLQRQADGPDDVDDSPGTTAAPRKPASLSDALAAISPVQPPPVQPAQDAS